MAFYSYLLGTLEVPINWYTSDVAFGTSTPSQDFVNLSQLLQQSDFDRVRLPTRRDGCDQKTVEEEQVIVNEERLSLLPCTSVLSSLDVSDWLVLRARDKDSKPNEVRGGPKDALIAYATQPSGPLLYQEAFLATYRTFITSLELIRKLVQRYLFMCGSKDQASTKVARQTFSVLVRVVDELCSIELSRDLIKSVTSFVYKLIRDGKFIFARLLRKRLMARIEQKFGYTKKTDLHDYKYNVKDCKPSSLFEFRSSVIAKQMTLLDADLFQKIESPEMLWWAQEQDEKKSPNLCLFTEHFNKVSYWVRTLVIQPNDHKLREKFMMKFMKIMKQLRLMSNYNSYLAILSALDSGPVRRLDWSKAILDILKEHSTIMDSSHSFRNYRNLLAESRPPCLPYIGLVLQDLTFVHIGNNDFLPPQQFDGQTNLVNYAKRWQQFAILDSVRRFKTWNYSIERDDRVLQFFGGFSHYFTEDEVWERSEMIKPRTKKHK